MIWRFSARAVAAFGLALALGCLVAGCSNSTKPGDKKTESPLTLPRTSPENVLYNLRVVYDTADVYVKTEADTLTWKNKYQELFHPDTFAFYFVPGDQPPGWPNNSWGLIDEVRSFKNMLRQEALGGTDDIELNWVVNPAGPDTRVNPEAPDQLLHPTWRHIYVTAILLDVVQGNNTWRVANGTADFYFAPDPADSTLWVITEWQDHAPGFGSPPDARSAAAPSTITWGAIKGLYH